MYSVPRVHLGDVIHELQTDHLELLSSREYSVEVNELFLINGMLRLIILLDVHRNPDGLVRLLLQQRGHELPGVLMVMKFVFRIRPMTRTGVLLLRLLLGWLAKILGSWLTEDVHPGSGRLLLHLLRIIALAEGIGRH